jgi:DNA polymerase-1
MGTEAQRPQITKKPWMETVRMELVTTKTLERVIDECINSGSYAIDLETTGLDNRVFNGRTRDHIVGICLSPDGDVGYYIPVRHEKGEEHNLPVLQVEEQLRRLVASEAVARFHNAKFDQEFLQFAGGEPIGLWDEPKKWEDTLILAWLRDTRSRQKGLKHLSKIELGFEMIELKEIFPPDYKGELSFAQVDPSDDFVVWYAASDAICTYRLFDILHPQVIAPEGNRAKGQTVIYNLEKMCVPATRWMERCRVPINQDVVAELMELGHREFFECMTDVYDFCNEAFGRNVEPGFFHVLRKKFKADDPDYNINQQIDDCRLEARRKDLDALDSKGHFIKVQKGDKAFPEKYDILSRQQLGPLFEELEIPDLAKTEKSGQIKTTASEIDRLNDRHGKAFPFLPKIKRLGELQKALGTYLISLRRDTGPDGTIKVNYNQLGTDTGRFTTPSSKKPEVDGGTKFPMHGTPAIYDTKRPQCLLRVREGIVPRPGKILGALDFGGVELRIATNLSGEPLWIKEFFRCSSCGQEFDTGNGEDTPEAPPAYCPRCGDDRTGDLHTLTGIAFFGESKVATKEWKKLRGQAKSSNFALVFGGGPNALVRAANIPEQEAARHHRTFNNTYGTLRSWWDWIKAFGRKNGYVLTALGRHYPIPDILLPVSHKEEPDAFKRQLNRKFKAKAERNATNGPIQGTSADLTKLAMGLIYREVKKRNWFEKVDMYITIHDELVFGIDYDIAAEALPLFQDIMTRNKTVLRLKWKVPLTTDCEVGFDWTVPWDLKDFKFQRVRPDGLQVDEKGLLPRKKETGELKAKIWPPKMLEIFGPKYGFAPVLDNPTEEEGKKLFGDDWTPLPLADGSEPAAAPQAPQEPSAESGATPVCVEPQAVSEAPVVAPSPPSMGAQMPPLGENGEYIFSLRTLGVGVAEKLARVIVECQGRGTHPLRVYGPTGTSVLWSDAKIMVNPIEFEVAARHYGI